ncbi:MAG: hypothetical protein WA695_02660 [Candidatus Dormiibacterota bacterium]
MTPTMDDDVDLRMIVRRHTPRDSDPNYTKFFAEQFFQALLRADRVTLSDSAAGKVRAFWVDADGGKLLDLKLPPRQVLPFVRDWASWKVGHGGSADCVEDRRTTTPDNPET